MKVQNTKNKTPDELFIQEFFGTFDISVRDTIQSILDLYQDKWSIRLMLMAFYFLEKKANEISVSKVRDYAYGTDDFQGLVRIFHMENWSYFGGIKDEELVKSKKLITGRKNARNIPNNLCDEGIIMQKIGKNIELTPLGSSLCKYLFFKFLQENGFSLKILSDFYKLSSSYINKGEILESLPKRISITDCINMKVLIKNDQEKLRFHPICLNLYEFILDHPYLDIRAANTLKIEMLNTLEHYLIEIAKKFSEESYITEKEIVSLQRKNGIKWIYELKLKDYPNGKDLQKWFTSLFELKKKIRSTGFILHSEPGTGKTIWLLQQTLNLFLGNFKENGNICLENSDFNLIPIFLPLRDFSIREINDRYEIFYKELRVTNIKEDVNDASYIRAFWGNLFGIMFKGQELELWGRSFLKLFDRSNWLILGDGWDELTPNLKKFLANMILVSTKQTKISFHYLISTRYIENSMKPLIQEKRRKNNQITLEKPSKDQVLRYLDRIGVKWINNEKSRTIIDERFGNTLTPMNLWLLGLFPNFENLPTNRAELYERWIKYEALREIGEKLNKRFERTFLSTIRTIKNYKDLDILLDEEIRREVDNKVFPLMQFIEGPIPGIIEKSERSKQKDYGLLRLLPKLVYNRIGNPNFYENYHEIVQFNPLFNRFIRYYNDAKNRPNFMLINTHYDYYLAALHCFNRYKEGLIFDFLGQIDRKKGLDSIRKQWDHYGSSFSKLIESLFIEILDITNERRETDIHKNITHDMIILRNTYDSLPKFNDKIIGYPLNQNGPYIFKLKIKNFIDPHAKQIYKYYWDKFISEKGELPEGTDLIKFQSISNSLVNNEREIKNLFANILSFQGKYVRTSVDLDEILDILKMENPHIIPIIVYAYDIHQTKNLSLLQIEKLKKSRFFKIPWVKLWIFRAIIKHHPKKIKKLTNYALYHTYNYLLKFCALNIISPLEKEIENEVFDLSLSLFQRVPNKYKELIIFQWASHLLSTVQLAKLKKLENNYHYGTKASQKIVFDLQYLLILHSILPKNLEYHLQLKKIPPKKVLLFLVALHKSGLVSDEKLQKIIQNNLTLKSVIYIHRILLENLEIFSYEGIQQEITPTFKNVCLESCNKWWKKNTPYQRQNINKMLREITPYFSKSRNYKENKKFENQKFRLKRYLENLNDLPESDKIHIFLTGKEILHNLLKKESKSKHSLLSITHAEDFFELFNKWLIDWGDKDHLIEFYYEFKDYFEFDDFFFRVKNKINGTEFSSLLIQHIQKRPKDYLLKRYFNKSRKSHPNLASEGSIYQDNKKFEVLRFLPERQIYKLLKEVFNIENYEDLFNYVYNLCNIGSNVALRKVANLWDENYVDVNKKVYNLYKNAYDDPSFYIWCAIPHELLDKVYTFLENPIAKIFYLVCLSIQDTFRPREMNLKYSKDNDNSPVLKELKEFSQKEIEKALIEFLNADWNLLYFRFLFRFIELTDRLMKCMIENVRSGRRNLSDILMIELKIRKNFQKKIITQFFELNKDITTQFCYEIINYFNVREKLNLFSELLKCEIREAASFAINFWEDYENLVLDLNDLNFIELKRRLMDTNNYNYIKKLVRYFRVDTENVQKLEELEAIKKKISELEKLIEMKLKKDSLFNLEAQYKEFLERNFEHFWKNIQEKEIELKAINLEITDFYNYLSQNSRGTQKKIINSRFPSVFYRRAKKSIIWEKIDELNWIISQHFELDIKNLVLEKYSEYQKTKEEILKYPERNHEEQKDYNYYFRKSSETINLNGLSFKKDISVNFVDIKNIKSFLSELTIEARQRALFHSLDLIWAKKDNNKTDTDFRFKDFQKNRERIEEIFSDYLSEEKMEAINEHYLSKIKEAENNTKNYNSKLETQISFQNEFIDDFDDIYYTKEKNLKSKSVKEEIYRELLNEDINVSKIEDNLRGLGDYYEFREYISLFLEISDPDYFFGRNREIFHKILNKNHKTPQKYLFYWILRQRKYFENNLSRDSIAYADESNQIYDVDQGISIDNLFEEVYINSINYGYFPKALNYLKDSGHLIWYNILKNFTLLQLEPGIDQISKVQYQQRSRLNIPINNVIRETFEEDEIRWSLLIYSATKFYNIINIQLFDLPQFLNGFKFRKSDKNHYDDYDDISLDIDF